MLASIPASMVNQTLADLGIPNRFNLSSSRFSVDLVGLLQRAHRLGILPDVARIGDGAGQAFFPQQQKGPAFIATGRLHRHQLHPLLAAERCQRRDPGPIVPEAAADSPRFDAGIEPGLRNIHSTNDLHHGNLPCSCDRDLPTVRSCVTTAMIPGSPTVVAKGASGDVAARFGRWPPAKALSRFHRTFCSMGRYKGLLPRIQLAESPPHPD